MTSDQQDKQVEWLNVSIIKDIGVNEATIINLDLKLETINNDIAVAAQFDADATAEKILREMANSSSLFLLEATKELNAVEGVPGQPGVHEF